MQGALQSGVKKGVEEGVGKQLVRLGPPRLFQKYACCQTSLLLVMGIRNKFLPVTPRSQGSEAVKYHIVEPSSSVFLSLWTAWMVQHWWDEEQNVLPIMHGPVPDATDQCRSSE